MFVGKFQILVGLEVMVEAVGHEITFGKRLVGEAANAIYGEGLFGHSGKFQCKGRELPGAEKVVFRWVMVFFTDWSSIRARWPDRTAGVSEPDIMPGHSVRGSLRIHSLSHRH